LPLLERVRVEVYIPDPHQPEYDKLLRLFQEEFTYTFGGCTILRGLDGSYLSQFGNHIPDRINLIYTDAPLALSVDFALIARYTHQLKRVASESLTEEAVMVAVEQTYHVV
jgi:hypothetical protein